MFSGVIYAISPQEQAKAFANQEFKTGFAQRTLEASGILTSDEVGNAYLGEPIKNYLIDINSFDSRKTIQDNLKPMSFYTFPVMVNNKIVSDFTVALEKGEWQFVDVGGNQSKLVYEMSQQNRIPIEGISILRYGGKTYFLSKKGAQDIGYAPYFSNSSVNLEKRTTVSIDIIYNDMKQRQQEFEEFKKDPNNKDLIGGPGFGSYSPSATNFKQQDGLSIRLARYLKYKF